MAVSLYSTLSLLFIVISSPCLAIYTISDYRLITKDRPNAGIVEVFNQNIGWGLVCRDNWSFELASIVCSQLNFPGTSRHLTAVSFDDDGDKWPKSVTNNISTYFTGCSVDGTNMQCERCNGECDCKFDYFIGAVSCKEPGYLGCFSDADSLLKRHRVLSDGPHRYAYMTIDMCINACEQKGSFYAGVEYGNQCFCGRQDENLIRHGNATDEECSYYPCEGDPIESCGNSDIIAIYQVDLGVCEDPGTPRNGFRYTETGSLRYGSKIYFNCSDQFTLEGPEVIQCVKTYGRREDGSIANSTHAVMWNKSLPKCTVFSSTTPSSATTKGGGQANPVTFIGATDPEQQNGPQVITYISVGVVSGLIIIIIAIIVVVVIRKRRKRKAECLDPTAPDIEPASRNHGNGGGSPLISRGDGEGDLFVLTDLTAHSKTAGENNYVDDNERQPPTYPGAMDRPGITRDAFGYESVRLPSADSALNGPGGIPGEVPVDGAIDLYANTEFHDVPTNLVDNELYG